MDAQTRRNEKRKGRGDTKMKSIKNKVLRILFAPIGAIIFLIGWVLAWIGGST